MVIISLELTRVNPDRSTFSINVELTSTFFTLQRFGPSPSPNFKFMFFISEKGKESPLNLIIRILMLKIVYGMSRLTVIIRKQSNRKTTLLQWWSVFDFCFSRNLSNHYNLVKWVCFTCTITVSHAYRPLKVIILS